MPSQLQLYAQLADTTATMITGSMQSWTSFLTTAARLYKYPYHEQLMIYAQRPEATACADYDLWNKTMHRYIRRGAKGIALIDTQGDNAQIKYVFDVADTKQRKNARQLNLWEYRPEQERAVLDALSRQFDISPTAEFPAVLEDIASAALDEYWNDHQREILDIIDDSFLEGYDDNTIRFTFHQAATVSATYMMFSRCGFSTGTENFDHMDFMPVFDFNTPATVSALGTAASQTSEKILRQIEVAVKKYERQKESERSQDYEQERTDLHPQRRLPDPQPEPVSAGAAASGQIREDAQEVPSGTETDSLESHDSHRNPVLPSEAYRPDSEQPVGTDAAPDESSGRGDGGTEGQRSHEVGGADEHSESAGGGDYSDGTDLRLTDPAPEIRGEQFSFFPTEAEQIQIIDEAERAETAPSAFALSQDHIDDILRLGFKSISSRMETVSLFQKQLPIMDIAHRLPDLYQEYSGFILNGQDISVWFDNQCIHIAQGRTGKFVSAPKILPWQTAAERIGTLMEEGRFATNTEVVEAPSYMLRKLAQKLHLIRDDMRASTREAGYLATIVGEYTGGYTDSMENTMKSLSDPVSRETIVQEYKAFLDAYQADRQIMRGHRHDFDGTLRLLEELSLPIREYATDMVSMPEAGRFITDDEIDDALVSYTPFANGKQRIYQFFQETHTSKEQADMLKSEYGTGGKSNLWADSSGIRFQSSYAPEVKLSWSKVAARIDSLIQNGRYLTPDEQKHLQEQQAQSQQANPTDPGEAIWQYNGIKEQNPDKLVLFQIGDFFEIYGDEGQAAAKKLGLTMGERKLPNGITIDMAAIPANSLEQSIEMLRRDYGVLIAAYQEGQAERQLYPMEKLEPQHEVPEPKGEITQEDIDEVLTTWRDWMPPKQEVIAYMKEHGRERATAAWLAQVYGFSDAKLPMQITVSGISEPAILTWPKVQRRVNQLIQEDKFLTEQEKAQIAFSAPRPPRHDPKRFSVRELPDGNGDLAIWDATHRIFHHRDNVLIRFDNAVSANNYLSRLQNIAKDTRNGTLEDSAFHVGASITYHVNDTFRSQRNPEQKRDCVIDYVNDSFVWYTNPDKPEQAPQSIRRSHFENCLEDGTFYLTDPYEKLIQNLQQEKAQISSALPSEDSPGQFTFGKYHFVPIGNFKEGYDLEEVMRSQIRSDPAMGISKYDWGTVEYSHAAFYEASSNSAADVFLCVENGRCYLPGENELFHYTGDFQEIKQEKPVPEQISVPTIRQLYDRYLPFVREGVEQDIAYRNACGHSDRENAVLECNAAIRRVVLEADDTQLLKLFVDMPDFRRRLQKDIIEQTYQPLHELLRPLSQDDIDNALRAWNGNMASKRAVVRYLTAHGQEEDAAEWLSREYDGDDNSGMIQVRAGSPEATMLPWPTALSRIIQLIQADDFYTEQELDNFEDIDPVAIREALEESGIVNGQVVDAEKLENTPFIQQVRADVEQIAQMEDSLPSHNSPYDDFIGITVDMEGRHYQIVKIELDEDIGPLAILRDIDSPEVAPVYTTEPLDFIHMLATDKYPDLPKPIPFLQVREVKDGAFYRYAVWDRNADDIFTAEDGTQRQFDKEWEATVYMLEQLSLPQKALMEKAKGLIEDFCIQEHGSGPPFFYLDEIGIAYTTEEDTDIPIQVSVDLVNYQIKRFLGGIPLEPRQYTSLQELIDNELIALDFNDLISVSQEEIESYYQQIGQPIPIAEFRRSNGRWVQGWEVPSIGADIDSESSGIFFADRSALYDAIHDFERANEIPNPVIDENGNYTDKEFLYSAYDEYVGMSHRAELEAYIPRFVNLAEGEPVEPYLAQIYYAKQNGLDEEDIKFIIEEANASGQPYTVEKASATRLILEDRLDRWNPEINPEAQYDSFEEILEDDPNLPWADELHNPEHYEDDYGLLSRLKADCEYFLGSGQREERNLFSGNLHAHIQKMRELYDLVPEKPEWLTKDQIDSYEERMARRYQVVTYHTFVNGFDDRHAYQTLQEAEKAASGYIDGTMEANGFQYEGSAIFDLREQKYIRIYGNYPDERAQNEIRGLFPEKEISTAQAPSYSVGDTVYLDNTLFEITEVGSLDVQLRDPSLIFPIFRAESKERFARLLRHDSRNEHLFVSEVNADQQPQFTTEQVAFYPGEKNHLPYDISVQVLHTSEPERTPPAPAVNFRITDDNLGVGGPKVKYRKNIEAIRLLKELEAEDRPATPEEQTILSQYVGWGGIPDAFDPHKENWSKEFSELQQLLTPEEYKAAKGSVLNAHYTSPTVIRAIYEAMGNLGFQSGNILEPAMGVGNFFGMLPEQMQNSKLYGVELDSISGRIARKLYPQANITIAGFETTDRRDFYDLAIGNVPFGQYKVNDLAYNKLNFNIHNYFFAKALDQVRPGGVVAFVTSRYTMDAQNPTVRKYLAQRADLLGAIRLPNNAFKANAGTEVVSDILFLQKRDRPIEIEPDWVHLGLDENGYGINSYFIDHPEMIMGRNAEESTGHGMDYTVEPLEDILLADQLHEAAQRIQGSYQEAELPDLGEGEEIRDTLPADPEVKNYSYTLVDGEVYFRENSIMVKPDMNKTAKERVKGMIGLRTCVHELIDLQMDEWVPDSAIKEKQKELNHLYDSYTAKYGIINNRGNKLAFSDDSSYFLLCALEIMDDEGNFKRKADMFTKRTIQAHKAVTAVDTASEALTLSIAEKAEVDMAYMSSLSGKTIEELAHDLRGVIFKDPTAGDDPAAGWQTSDEYLSGNVRKKLRQAEAAAANDSAFSINVEALQAAQPKDLEASEIDVRLGATWIDKSYIWQFMLETFDPPDWLKTHLEVNYSKHTAAWNISGKGRVSSNDIAATSTYGTRRMNAYDILEDSLNLRDVRVYDTIEDEEGHKRRVLNGEQTTLAAQKQQMIRDAFKDWIWADPERRQALVKQYNEEMNSTRPREYDGSHIVFAGMNPEISLREHQRNAIAHTLYGGNTLLAHEVGAGKTFEMVASAMEAKRLGLCRKSIFVVPNHLTEQWASEFLRLYPSANLLVTKQKDFQTHNRKKFCARIATGDYDAIIIGHSQFERIPISQERQQRIIQDQIDEIEAGIRELESSGAEQFTVKQLERTLKSLEDRLEKLKANHRKDDVVTFEQLGVDRLFVDEAHSYKNMFFYTKMQNVAGLSTSDAQKSSDMFAKCRYMDELTGSRGVIFATGTPVSNSMTELFTMQRYLQHEQLEEMDMIHFDCWASRFGETKTALELAPEGKGYRPRTRFSRFHNLPELMNLFKEVADIKTADQLHLPVPEVEYHNVVAQPTEIQQGLVHDLSERAVAIHSGTVPPEVDNMLKITSDGRKLGLDQRLINPNFPDEEGTKVNQCVENILQVWRDGEADKLTQLVFCDVSTPKNDGTFNIYNDIRTKLIAHGMPPEQIAFIHDAKTDAKKKELFGKVRSGQVRVLLGSTQKMGAGTNCQDRLVAIHDLDCPWRPGDLAQRKGRIERQGNMNKLVHVYRYVTEGTFDAYLWQTVENKQKFISQIMSSKSPVRSCDDVDETALSFAEIKALCAGDPRIKERMDLDVDVSRLKIMKSSHQNNQYRLQDNLLKTFPEQISKYTGLIQAIQTDMQTLQENPHPVDGFSGMTVLADTLTEKDNAGAALLEAVKQATSSEPVVIGSYRGFKMLATLENFGKTYFLTLKGKTFYRAELGSDPRGNLTRLDNVLNQMPQRLQRVQSALDDTRHQQAAANAELGKPFPFEDELREKNARLIALDAELNLDGPRTPSQDQVVAKSARPSLLAKLKATPTPIPHTKSHKHQKEVR